MSKPPIQKPGKSNQSVGTPENFLDATRKRLGIIDFMRDLAADHKNYVVPLYFTEADDALQQIWYDLSGWQWLNPPYVDIYPWVQKAAIESNLGARIAVLVPAGVGTLWWNDCVSGIAHVHFLKGRITFKGHKTAYPKDLVLLLYNRTVIGGYSIWDWRKELSTQ